MVWRYEWRANKKNKRTGGVGDWDKPLDARTLRVTDGTDPASWSTFDDALACYHRGGVDGIGFVPPGERGEETLNLPDLDMCVDPETLAVEPWAREIVDRFATYTERSPYGDGLRLVCYGLADFGSNGKGGAKQGRKRGRVEVYRGGHYLTITGERLPDAPTVERRPAALAWLLERFLDAKPERKEKKAGRAKASGRVNSFSGQAIGDEDPWELSDEDLLGRAYAARNGDKLRRLMDGDTTDYKSQSEADSALAWILAFWTKDAGRLERLFGRSKLAERGKWSEREDDRKETIERSRFETDRRRVDPQGRGEARHADRHQRHVEPG